MTAPAATTPAVIGDTNIVIIVMARFEKGPSPKDSSDIFDKLFIKPREIGIQMVIAIATTPANPSRLTTGLFSG